MPHQGMGSARMLPMQGLHVRLCPVCQNGMFGRVWGKSAPGNQDATHQRTFVPGEVVCRKGARGKSVYSVCKGAVKLEVSTPDGHPRVVRVLQAGAVFGLEVLSDISYHHTVTCLGRTQLCEIPADAVIAELCTGPARVRLARLLLHMARGHITQTCQSMSREDMASLLDLTPETVSRTMAAFKRSGLVAERSGVLACELPGLERISQGMD